MNKLIAIFFLMFSIFFTNHTNAQWYDAAKVNKKAVALFEKAYTEVNNNNYPNTIAYLTEALKIEPNYLDAMQARASVFSLQKEYSKAILDYEMMLTKDSIFAFEYLPTIANAYAGNGNFEKAAERINQFLNNTKLSEQNKNFAMSKKTSYDFAVMYQKNHPFNGYTFNPINLGDSINTSDLEYLPSTTIDENKLIFNRRINGDEDFYESNKINGIWRKATPMQGKINTNLNEGAQNISQDGTMLVFTGCNYPEGLGSCDLYVSYKNNNGIWSEAQNMGPTINTEAWETSPSLSADKKDLYFSSTRAGGYGGSDIWVSHFENNKWQKPQNLGPTINTNSNESCVFIHADNSTLYFNSSGHTGYGMNDLFLSKKDTNNNWTSPLNLGYPINTINDEGALIVAANGKTAYYASDNGDIKNKLDLYTFELRNDLQATKTWWVKGKIFDKKTSVGLPSEIELFSLNDNKIISKFSTDENGNYLITLPIDKNYAFEVNKKGYLFNSENFSLKDNFKDSITILNIALQPLEKGAAIILKNIFFDTKKSELQNASYLELDKVVKTMTENANIVIQISGHTDNVGQAKDNLLLSNNRAKAVTNYLIKKGIAPKRLTAKGFGSSKPIATNANENGKAKNRRTELTIISN